MPRVSRCRCGWPSFAARPNPPRLRFSITAPPAARSLHLSTSTLERPRGVSSREGLALPISLCGCSSIPVRGESRIATLHHPTLSPSRRVLLCYRFFSPLRARWSVLRRFAKHLAPLCFPSCPGAPTCVPPPYLHSRPIGSVMAP